MLQSIFQVEMRPIYTSLAFATLLIAAPLVCAQDGFQGALTRAGDISSLTQAHSQLLGPTLAIADLDSDSKPDGAVLVDSGQFRGVHHFNIELHFAGRNNAGIAFQSNEPVLSVSAWDIDHDGDIDLVVERAFTHERLQVWLNDGHGNFSKGRMEDFPSDVQPPRQQLNSSETIDSPVLSFSPDRGSDSLLLACHIAGRPPSARESSAPRTPTFAATAEFSASPSRAPPLS